MKASTARPWQLQTRKMRFLVTIEVNEEEFGRLCKQYLIREVKKVEELEEDLEG